MQRAGRQRQDFIIELIGPDLTLFRSASTDPAAFPGIIIAIQTYGDQVNFHPHLHAVVTDGTFTLEHLFRHRVLHLLLRERRLTRR